MAAEFNVERLTFKTNATSIPYDSTKPGGSDLARRNLAVHLSASGTVSIAGDNESVLGQLVDVCGDNTCSVAVRGVMTFLQGAASGVTVGDPIVGATGDSIGGQTNGYVKAAANTAAGARAGRGLATDVHSNTKGGEVSVLLP